MRLLALCLAAVAAPLLCQSVASQEPPPANVPAYNIELIIFRATSALGAAENWAAEAGARNVSNDSNAGEPQAAAGTQVGRFLNTLPR